MVIWPSTASHLPLDLHPRIGNNVLLARELGLTVIKSALPIKGQTAGVIGKIKPTKRLDFAKRISEAVGERVHLAPAVPR